MKLQYLGTAAAEAFPGLFCSCEKCVRARLAGGRNLRTRSQAVVNGKILIDFPADTCAHVMRYGLDLLDIRACLITHIHGDHFYPTDLSYARRGFSDPGENWEGLDIYGSEDIAGPLAGPTSHTEKMKIHTVEPYVPFETAGCTVTALKASHGSPHPYIYIISDGEKTMLYGNDTGLFPAETMDYIRSSGVRFDLVSLDCTGGMHETLNYPTHMCIGLNEKTRADLTEAGAADGRTLFVLNHFSHNGLDALYDDFAPKAAERGFLTSYDGMTVEF